jgi:hypothetical protein
MLSLSDEDADDCARGLLTKLNRASDISEGKARLSEMVESSLYGFDQGADRLLSPELIGSIRRRNQRSSRVADRWTARPNAFRPW